MNLTFTKATNMDAFDFSRLRGNDVITGSYFNDKLRGDAGNDYLYGRLGKDTLYGGTGADRFVFKSVLDSWAIFDTKSMDTVMDFSRRQGDKFDLRGVDANEGRAGNQAFTFIGTKGFTGRAGELAYTREKGGVYVGGDTDGDGSPDLVFFVRNNSALLKSDFYL